jgi:spore maturation protein CgeB
MTLNVTRQAMVMAGYSPSVRLFEAAASGATIVSDCWEGLETFLSPAEEILLADSAADVVAYLTEMDSDEIAAIGRRAQERVHAEHTADRRAAEFESAIAAALDGRATAGKYAKMDGLSPVTR